MSEYKPSKAGQPISINIDEWIKERRQPDGSNRYPGVVGPNTHPSQVVPLNETPEELERVRELRETLRTQWEDRLHIAERDPYLDPTARMCVECSKEERHYINDYMCYKCRDQLEESNE